MFDQALGTQYGITVLYEPGLILSGILSVVGTWWLILRGNRPGVYFALAMMILLPTIAGGFVFVSQLEDVCRILSSSNNVYPQDGYKFVKGLGQCLYSLRLGVGFTLLSLVSAAFAMSFSTLRNCRNEALENRETGYCPEESNSQYRRRDK